MQEALDTVQANLKKAAFEFHETHVRTCMSKDEMVKALDESCVARIPFHSMDMDGKDSDAVVHELTMGEVSILCCIERLLDRWTDRDRI